VRTAQAVGESPDSSFTDAARVLEEDWNEWVIEEGKALKAFQNLYTPEVQLSYIVHLYISTFVVRDLL
jgi:hypothetical protein